jgi:hypothetical protein
MTLSNRNIQFILKIRLSIFFLLLVSMTNAQLTKKTMLLGGSGGFQYSRGFTDASGAQLYGNNVFLNLGAGVGYFVLNKFALGINPGFTYQHYMGSNNRNFQIGAFGRYYFLNSQKKINLFAQAGYSYSYSFNESKYYQSQTNISQYGVLSFKAGPVWFISKSVALELSVNIKSGHPSFYYSRFSTQLGFQIHFNKE